MNKKIIASACAMALLAAMVPAVKGLSAETRINGLILSAYAQEEEEDIDAAAQKYAEKQCKPKKPVMPKLSKKGKKESDKTYKKRVAAYEKKKAEYQKKLERYEQCIEEKTEEYYEKIADEEEGSADDSSDTSPNNAWNRNTPSNSNPAPSGNTGGQPSAADSSLAQQLMSRVWCTSSYSGSVPGYSSFNQTRYQFMADRTVLSSTYGETSSRGYGGSFDGTNNSAPAVVAQWKITNGRLYVANADTGGRFVDSLSEITSYGFKSGLLNLEFAGC